ncbi:hypothetical protein QAD02_021774 [Eretmocerus hayati]|uniref:Uncharacterized protein n=1 Tax=Eretmocerus hayati TaxID=131215 RepID=A0ACC2PSQ7_9HYME|nr:hypothetical protein QAD02_021774 [Eretmocerus hayati]
MGDVLDCLACFTVQSVTEALFHDKKDKNLSKRDFEGFLKSDKSKCYTKEDSVWTRAVAYVTGSKTLHHNSLKKYRKRAYVQYRRHQTDLRSFYAILREKEIIEENSSPEQEPVNAVRDCDEIFAEKPAVVSDRITHKLPLVNCNAINCDQIFAEKPVKICDNIFHGIPIAICDQMILEVTSTSSQDKVVLAAKNDERDSRNYTDVILISDEEVSEPDEGNWNNSELSPVLISNNLFISQLDWPNGFPDSKNDIGGICIGMKNFTSLQDTKELDDNVINASALLMADLAKAQELKVLAMETLITSAIFDSDVVKDGWTRWAKNSDLFDHDILLVPIHQNKPSKHWTLLLIVFQKKIMYYFDSLHKDPKLLEIEKICSFLGTMEVIDWAEWSLYIPKDIPEQIEGDDYELNCGVHACGHICIIPA